MDGPASGPWVLVGIGAFGWVWGSFLNTVVDRTPRRDQPDPGLGWFSPPRSICLSCGSEIPWYENLPIVSYLFLRGRCRACGATIGRRTLAVEVVTPLLFVALAGFVNPLQAGLWLLWWGAMLSASIVALPLFLEHRRLREIATVGVVLIVAGAALALLT